MSPNSQKTSVRKVPTWLDWVYRNKGICLGVIAALALIRFGYLIYYNWTCGNTGTSGVQYYVDSYRYLDGANQLLKHQPFGHKQVEYSGYIALLAFVKWATLPLEVVIAIQVIMALVSSWFLYDMAKSITGSRAAGIIAFGLYLANPFIAVWHLYILTESLYTSFLIIVVWSIGRALQQGSYKFCLLAFSMVCITATIRPNGWILFPTIGCLLILKSKYKPLIKYTGTLAVITLFAVGVACFPPSNKVIQNVEKGVAMNDLLTNGEVVWGHKELRLNMPQDSALQQANWTSSYMYILKHPFACTKLGAYRISSELLELNRLWYSTKYHILLLLWLWPAYLLAIIGAVRFKSSVNVKTALFIILGHLLIIALTYAEHEHRFLNYFLPLIYLLSACGISGVVNRYLGQSRT
jgi:4-amino-4-deoxy-L-arabinose transferase-like glycosyltransferase